MDRIKIVISDTAPLYPPQWGGPKRIWELYSHLSQDRFYLDYVGIDALLNKKTKPPKLLRISENL